LNLKETYGVPIKIVYLDGEIGRKIAVPFIDRTGQVTQSAL
jgi:hypothetical protein